MSDLTTGTITFLFTDVEGSTRLWEQHPAEMCVATACHDAIVEENVERQGGIVVRPRGEGDSRFAVFALTINAIVAAIAMQVALHAEAWSTPQPVWVRMALHTGEADLREATTMGRWSIAVPGCGRSHMAGKSSSPSLPTNWCEMRYRAGWAFRIWASSAWST